MFLIFGIFCKKGKLSLRISVIISVCLFIVNLDPLLLKLEINIASVR